AYQIGGKRAYALEGSIFIAGAAVQWLRDGLKIIESAAQSAELAAAADPEQRVVLVPAFVGLGAPYWDSECRGAIFNLTRATTRRELAKAALESVCFQTRDLLEAMRRDWPSARRTVLRVDGGMAVSDYTMQRLADIIAAPVDRPAIVETTALGAAYLAGLAVGLYPPMEKFAAEWRRERRFAPEMTASKRNAAYDAWRDAVARTLTRGRLRKG
ncbi:MAG TPA: FGGY-family carbohydrate kinase, partial [Roseiarcus sp.]|nr:FGGY-family carbohydrate kinase [Roseiarcus sp.]